jgi:FkbM family methyltransferase
MQSFFENLSNGVSHIKIDVGLGMYNINSMDWLQNESNLCLICFEPNLDSKNSCISHINKINDKLVQNNNAFLIVPFALSDVTEPTKLNFYSMLEDGGTSSLYKPLDTKLGPVKCETIVDAYPLKHFLDLFPWDRFEYIDYIKIDAQGADLDIIKGAGDYLKDRVVFITAEPESNQYVGCNHNTTENMIEYLKTQGFEKINHPNTCDPTFLNNKYKHLCDKIYINQFG